jgi:hypothetical protein
LNVDRNPLSAKPLISADGRRVFFQSRATNLTPQADANLQSDVFARDLQPAQLPHLDCSERRRRARMADLNWPVSHRTGGKVAFISTSTDLVSDGPTSTADVYVRDIGAVAAPQA